MNDVSQKLRAEIEKAVRNTIKAMGVAQFRQTSFFASNLKVPAKKAA